MILLMLYIFINILNFFITIFLKVISKNISSTSEIVIKNKRLQFKLKDLYYKNSYIDNLKLIINARYFPSISINYLEYHINNLNISEKPKIKFELWSNNNNLNNSFNRISNNVMLFNLFIKVVRIYYSPDLYLDIYGLNIFKLSTKDTYVRLKIKNIKMYYLNSYVGKIRNLKITFRSEKTIYCDEINVLFNKMLLDNYFIDTINKFYKVLNSGDCSTIPKIMIRKVNTNIYLHNYISMKLDNIVFENSILHLSKIKIKIWKKDSIWIDNFKINILDKIKNPIIGNIRIRLFYSTSDKLYKTLIILRKKFFPIAKRPVKQKYKKQAFVINNNYISTIPPKPAKVIDDANMLIIDKYFTSINSFIVNYKLTIVNLVIKFSYKYGEICAENLEYKVNKNYNILSVDNWKFYNKQTIFIQKHTEDDSKFYIKFNKHVTHIIPYKMDIYFECFYYKNMGIIFKQNIERINNLFYSSYYIYNKGYVYELFHIDSFMGILNYKKTDKNFRALIGGNRLEILNYIDVHDLNILLNEVKVSYPKDWNDIVQKISSVYNKSIYNSNFRSIVTKISGEKTASVLFMKDNLKYLKKKLVNTFKT